MRKAQLGNANAGFGILVFIVLMVGLIIFRWSRELGVDFEVLLRATLGSAVVLVLYFGYLFFSQGAYFRLVTCASSIIIWPLWWQVLIGMDSSSLLDSDGWYTDTVTATAWYASAWFRWGAEALLIAAGGYTWWSYSRDRW